MNDEKCVVGKPAKVNAYNDERFTKIENKARELKGLLRELRDLSYGKFNELLGAPPADPCDTAKETQPESWADKVLYEQDIALRVVRETLERLGMV